jgi:4'-phosphopantetheinyl transferase
VVMNSKPLHLWYAYPDDLLDSQMAQSCAALLTPQENERWRRYRFEKNQRESLATRALVRTALSHYRAGAPEAWRFRENEHGKPFLDPDCGLQFNVSNSVGMVVCLVAEGAEVGVDVESHARSSNIMTVVERVFSEAERAQLDKLDYAAKLDRVLSLWTLKEAYIKARGMGLALPLDKISFLFGGAEGIRLEIEADVDIDPGRWRFCSFDHSGHRIAVAVEGDNLPEMSHWEARPLLAPPLHLAACSAQWFPLSLK